MLTIPCVPAHVTMPTSYNGLAGVSSLLSPFAQWLKQTREQRGLSINALADKSGLSSASISFYEKDQRSAKRENVRALANALEVPVASGLRAAGFVPDPEEEAEELAAFGQMTPAGRRIIAYDELGNPAELSGDSLYRLDLEFELSRKQREHPT